MKKIFLIMLTAGIFSFTATSCGSNTEEGHEAQTEAAENAESDAAEEAAEDEIETIDSVDTE